MMESTEMGMLDHGAQSSSILHEVISGLSRPQKSLPPKLLYDKRGSEIFEKICLLKEYYPTRAETEILKTYGSEIAQMVGPSALIIEPGSGAGDKIRYLLPFFTDLKGYVPIEISKEILQRMTEELHEEFPHLNVMPVCADFTQDLDLPLGELSDSSKKVIFFPGSTIGNLNPNEAINFLKKYAELIGHGGGFLIGVDLKKDAEIFKSAYDDSHGVTAEFNLNLLERLNREVRGSFDVRNFQHQAMYNEKMGRVEMHLVSKMPQYVKVNEMVFRFKEGETIHTENSYKYSVKEFSSLCSRAHLKLKSTWQDSQNLFCVYYFEKE